MLMTAPGPYNQGPPNEQNYNLDFAIQSSGIHSALWDSRSCFYLMPSVRPPKISPENAGVLVASYTKILPYICGGASSNEVTDSSDWRVLTV